MVSRPKASYQSKPPAIASAASCQRLLESSTAVHRNVTVPAGRAAAMAAHYPRYTSAMDDKATATGSHHPCVRLRWMGAGSIVGSIRDALGERTHSERTDRHLAASCGQMDRCVCPCR